MRFASEALASSGAAGSGRSAPQRRGRARSALFPKEREQPAERLASVADGVLRARCEFGRGLAEIGEIEVRVIAEAAAAARRGDDLAVPASLGDQGLGILRVAH